MEPITTDNYAQIKARVSATIPDWSEDDALLAFMLVARKHGWTVCAFTRADAEGVLNTPLTDDAWAALRSDSRWNDLFDDAIMDDLWTQVAWLVEDYTNNKEAQ